MEQNLDRPMAHWSDARLLEEYHSLTADLPESAGHDSPDKAEITDEILRRGLPFPDVSTVPHPESVDWSSELGGEDPGSGALPRSF